MAGSQAQEGDLFLRAGEHPALYGCMEWKQTLSHATGQGPGKAPNFDTQTEAA